MIYWFEYGGCKIGKLNMDIIKINQLKMRANQMQESVCSDKEVEAARNGKHYVWRAIGKYKDEFAPHQSIVIDTDKSTLFYILGSNGNKNSALRYDGKSMKVLSPMPAEKTFFATVYNDGFIYTFGGYDAFEKTQLSSCEYYSIRKDKWFNSEVLNPQGKIEYKLHRDRS